MDAVTDRADEPINEVLAALAESEHLTRRTRIILKHQAMRRQLDVYSAPPTPEMLNELDTTLGIEIQKQEEEEERIRQTNVVGFRRQS